MPVNSYGNDDFASSFLHGASVGNMIVQQRERQQELASEQALRAVQERHLAAQTDLLAYNLQQAQEDKVKEDAALQTHAMMSHIMVGSDSVLTPDEQTQQSQMAQTAADNWLRENNLPAYSKLMTARSLAAKPELAREALQTKENIANTQADARRYTADMRLKGLQDKFAGAGMQLEASGKFANRVITLERQARDARDNGDEQAADDAEREVQLMHEDLARTHPNAAKVLKQRMLQNKANEAYKQYLASGMKNKKLKDEATRTEEELKGLGEDSSGGAGATAPATGPAPAEQFKRGGGFKIKVIKP